MSVIQYLLLGTLFILVLITLSRFRQRDVKKLQAFPWLLLWLIIALVVIWPESVSRLAKSVGVGRGADLVLYIAVLAIFYFIFKIVIRLERMETHITTLVREIALKRVQKPEKTESNKSDNSV